MTKQQAQQIADELFPNYPSVNEFHITSDGQAFFDLHRANDHARKLEDKAVITATKDIEEATATAVEEIATEQVATEEQPEEAPKKGKKK